VCSSAKYYRRFHLWRQLVTEQLYNKKAVLWSVWNNDHTWWLGPSTGNLRSVQIVNLLVAYTQRIPYFEPTYIVTPPTGLKASIWTALLLENPVGKSIIAANRTTACMPCGGTIITFQNSEYNSTQRLRISWLNALWIPTWTTSRLAYQTTHVHVHSHCHIYRFIIQSAERVGKEARKYDLMGSVLDTL